MKQELTAAIEDLVLNIFDIKVVIELFRPEEQYGDYTTNIALQLSKQLTKKPVDVANQLSLAMRHDLSKWVTEVTVAGPGFINLKLADNVLNGAITGHYKPSSKVSGLKTLIETNNPNPFKAMHIGHAFNAIMADTIANLLEIKGNQTHRVSYHGDVGNHVGMSMWAILGFLNGDLKKLQTIPIDQRNSFMSEMYIAGNKAYKEDELAKKEIEKLAEESFSQKDQFFKTVYETCKAWSMDLLQQTIKRLGCQPTEKQYFESQAESQGVKIVKQCVGPVFTKSDGALIFDGSKYGGYLCVFVSSRDRGLYAARDLGLMELKNQDYQPDQSYIITAEEQRAYFKTVIKAAELCLPELNCPTINIPTGTVKLATGKMSSRNGAVLDIEWLFKQIEKAVLERGAQATQDVLIGALRYEFLRIRIGGDVIFDIKQATSINSNSGPYLQYSYARARSILSKVDHKEKTLADNYQSLERSLLRKISEYSEIIDKASADLLPHRICTYLYELAQNFNRFYEANRVIDDPRQDIRLTLVEAYATTLRSGLTILGIASPDKM